MPFGLLCRITPAKVGNIQKLKAFFGETVRIVVTARSDVTYTQEQNHIITGTE